MRVTARACFFRSSHTQQASALDPAEPVSLSVDLGGAKKLQTAEIQWEFPAKSFTVSVSTDGVTWTEVFATDSNVLSTTTIALGSVRATKARVVMHEVCLCAHALSPRGCVFEGGAACTGARNPRGFPGARRVWH